MSITQSVIPDYVIISFADKRAEQLFYGERARKLDPRPQRKALMKFLILDAAQELNDLKSPPGNRLESLTGDRAGQYSIRINDQWRICFVWTQQGPTQVEIVDFH